MSLFVLYYAAIAGFFALMLALALGTDESYSFQYICFAALFSGFGIIGFVIYNGAKAKALRKALEEEEERDRA